MVPATAPMTTAAPGSTKAHEAVMATSAASAPFAAMVISGLPITIHATNNPARTPEAAARFVVNATYAK